MEASLPGRLSGLSEETPLRRLLAGLDAIKVQYDREREGGRHVIRAQYNQAAAAVARCDPARPAQSGTNHLAITGGECHSSRVFQVVNGY